MHTQGPWKLKGRVRIESESHPLGVFIADMKTHRPGSADRVPDRDTQLANARLIAAAPRLVEALRPFARLWLRRWDAKGDDTPVWAADNEQITIGDIRRARALLAEINKEG